MRGSLRTREPSNHQHTTVRDHMPSSHRRYADWTPERIKRQAAGVGQNCAILVEVILRDRRHPEQGFRACLGIMKLAKPHGTERLEAACERALEINARTYSSVKSILQTTLNASAANAPRTALRSPIPISVALDTSIERTNDADTSNP